MSFSITVTMVDDEEFEFDDIQFPPRWEDGKITVIDGLETTIFLERYVKLFSFVKEEDPIPGEKKPGFMEQFR